MADQQRLIEQLRSTRGDFLDEVCWHKFLLDAAYGTGGFKGKFGATAISHLGWAAEVYARYLSTVSPANTEVDRRLTYLDQFPREDHAKFSKRIDVAHYTNYVGPLSELLVSYINKAEWNRDGEPAAVATWREDVDGKGTTWDVMQREVIRPRAALLGWTPVLFDWSGSSDKAEGALTMAERRQQKLAVRAYAMYPINVLSWICDEDGELSAVKLCTHHEVRSDLLGPGSREERYSLWYTDRLDVYTVHVDSQGKETVSEIESVEHDFGCVPMVIYRGKPTIDDKVRGLSIVADLAVANRRYFNLESEMDDHIRGQVFATLGIPVEDMNVQVGDIVSGNGGAIKIPMMSNMPLHYVAPPADVAATLEARMLASEKTMYRTQRVEHEAPTVQTSGVARAYQFEQTNRRLGDLAAGFGRSEQKSLRLVGDMMDAPGAEKTTVSVPTDFSIEDLAADIENATAAIGLKLGTTAETEIKKRIVRRILPNLPKDTDAAIQDELEEVTVQQAQDDAMASEMAKAGLDAQKQAGNQDAGAAEKKVA